MQVQHQYLQLTDKFSPVFVLEMQSIDTHP
jgi:hypothetical protein